jgi:hypothetical protein
MDAHAGVHFSRLRKHYVTGKEAEWKSVFGLFGWI